MGWLSQLFSRFRRQYVPTELIASARGWVEITGTIEGLELLQCPITGDEAVAVYYRAIVPGAASRAYAGLLGDTLHVSSQAQQATDFILRDASGAALIRPKYGPNLQGIHQELLRRHGLELQAGSELLVPGERIVVRGFVAEHKDHSTPHRRGPYNLVIDADEIARVEAD